MVTLSLCMIVKNEEDVLKRCIDSVKDAVNEIIIVDTGSTDNTKEIAISLGAKVFDFKWIDDFSAARNFAFSLATCDYIIWLDADDILKEQDLKKLVSLKEQLDKNVRQIAAKYNVAFDENDNVTFSYYRERIFLKEANFKWIGSIHETIAIEGNCQYSDFCVTHKKEKQGKPDRNLEIYEKLIKNGVKLSQRDLYYYARELYYNKKMSKAINTFKKFLKNDAWQEDKIGAHLMLAKCYLSLNNTQEALNILFRSFNYDLPRAEICCEIGNIYFNSEDYYKAIFWYKNATFDEKEKRKLSFSHDDCYRFIPFLQLCVCYDRLGMYDVAELYNSQAELIKPNNTSVLKNKEYFKTKSAFHNNN